MVHRLVAEAYIPNPNNLPQVDHIDNNPYNNNVENLRWVSAKENVNKSYSTMSPLRNFIECKLYKGDKFIMEFKSIKWAAEYLHNLFGFPIATLRKDKKYKDYVIKV